MDNVSLALWIEGKFWMVSLPADVMRALRMIARIENKTVVQFCANAVVNSADSQPGFSNASRIRAAVMRHLALGAGAPQAPDRVLTEPSQL